MIRKKKKNTIDGVVQRRPSSKMGNFDNPDPIVETEDLDQGQNEQVGFSSGFTHKNPTPFLKDEEGKIEAPEKSKDKKKFSLKNPFRRKRRRPMSKRKRIIKRIGIGAGAILALFVGVFIIKTILAINSIIDRGGDGAAALDGDISKLRGEGDGRVNILLVGIGGDGHMGGNLADTIIIASIDPIHKEVAMLSIPRDTYVEIPGYGENRINAAHAFGEEYEDPADGVALVRKTVENFLDIPIHYYVRVDFQGFADAVNAVGGVEFNVTNPVYDDYNFYSALGGPLNVPEGYQKFSGSKALYYARSRYTSPRGDFDRNQRQRDILLALKDKILSLDTFTDPRKLSSLISTAGSHARTDLQISEMLRLYEIAEEVPTKSIVSVGLDNSENNFLASQTVNGASVQVPKDPTYKEIQEYVRKLFVDGFIRSENAKIDVLNGTDQSGVATEASELLKTYGYNIQVVGDAPDNVAKTVIYDLSGGKSPYTKKYLEKRYNVTMQPKSQLPKGITTESQYVIIVGGDA